MNDLIIIMYFVGVIFSYYFHRYCVKKKFDDWGWGWDGVIFSLLMGLILSWFCIPIIFIVYFKELTGIKIKFKKIKVPKYL